MERQKIQEEQNKKKREEKHLELCEKERKCIEARIRKEKLIELSRQELLKKINTNQEKILKQKELNNRESQERLIEASMKKEDIEDNLIMKERAKEFDRLKKLAEIEERNKRVEMIKAQKNLIYEERRKMNDSLEKDKEQLLQRFNELMSQRGDKNKDELMKQLFSGDIYTSMSPKANKSITNTFNSANFSKIPKIEDKKNKEDENNEYNDFEKNNNFFVTNLPKSP